MSHVKNIFSLIFAAIVGFAFGVFVVIALPLIAGKLSGGHGAGGFLLIYALLLGWSLPIITSVAAVILEKKRLDRHNSPEGKNEKKINFYLTVFLFIILAIIFFYLRHTFYVQPRDALKKIHAENKIKNSF